MFNFLVEQIAEDFYWVDGILFDMGIDLDLLFESILFL